MRLTYDPPFEPVVPASQADSEIIRKVLVYYRKIGKDKHADYLQAILDDREGYEQRHLGPSPHPSGSEQDVHAGGGESARTVGISPHREGKKLKETARQIAEFEPKIRGIADVRSYKDASGVYKGQEEPSIHIEYAGDGNTLVALADQARDWDQDSAIVYGQDLEIGQETTVGIWTFDRGLKASERESVGNAIMSGGIDGWTWQTTNEGTLQLAMLSIPQFGNNNAQYLASTGAANEAMSGLGLRNKFSETRVKVAVAAREDDYQWR